MNLNPASCWQVKNALFCVVVSSIEFSSVGALTGLDWAKGKFVWHILLISIVPGPLEYFHILSSIICIEIPLQIIFQSKPNILSSSNLLIHVNIIFPDIHSPWPTSTLPCAHFRQPLCTHHFPNHIRSSLPIEALLIVHVSLHTSMFHCSIRTRSL